MNYWLINDGVTDISVNAEGTEVILRGKRLPRMKLRDELILIDGDRTFSHRARIVEAVPVADLSFSESSAIRLSVDRWLPLRSKATWDLLKYSLTFVREPDRQYLYRRRGFRFLPKHDAQTIIEGEPFVARTAYYTLSRAIPDSMRTEFEGSMRLVRESLTWQRTYSTMYEELLGFLRRRILSVGEMLVEIGEVLERLDLRTTNGVKVSHALVDDENEKRSLRTRYDVLATQIEAFLILRESLQSDDGAIDVKGDITNAVLSELDDSERRTYEQRFESVFRRELERI